jgi:hypothetical protein
MAVILQHGETSIHDACRDGHLPIVHTLYAGGCDLNIPNKVNIRSLSSCYSLFMFLCWCYTQPYTFLNWSRNIISIYDKLRPEKHH